MNAAAHALVTAPSFARKNGLPAGHDHAFAHSANGRPWISQRLGHRLEVRLSQSVAGMEFAYDPTGYLRHSTVGRCTVEIPLVSVRPIRPEETVGERRGRRSVLLHFRGSIDVCCEDNSHGPSIRNAIAKLAANTSFEENRTLIIAISRHLSMARCSRSMTVVKSQTSI